MSEILEKLQANRGGNMKPIPFILGMVSAAIIAIVLMVTLSK